MPNVCHVSRRSRFGFFLLAEDHSHGMTSSKASAVPSIASLAATGVVAIVSEKAHLFWTCRISSPPLPPGWGAIVDGKVKMRCGYSEEESIRESKRSKQRQETDNRGHTADNREQTTENRQQTTENRQQTTENRQQTTENRQQTVDNRQQTADNRQQTTDRRQQTADSRQQTADNRQQTADNRPQTTDRRQQTADSRQQTSKMPDRPESGDFGKEKEAGSDARTPPPQDPLQRYRKSLSMTSEQNRPSAHAVTIELVRFCMGGRVFTIFLAGGCQGSLNPKASVYATPYRQDDGAR
ncbi:pyruvate kinase [Venturia nashicola]|uniref:Pyruvate kinase n=1 Tax=Venturia nashicola TaxID=86259 RepID=A0A4Z1PBY3_9PEZI|nr:pyruvate kinase [Venturia nashicola]